MPSWISPAASRWHTTAWSSASARAAWESSLGRFEQAIELWEKASEVRPEDYQSPLLVAQAYEQLDGHAEAMRARRRGVTIVQDHLRRHPDDVRALYMGANRMVALGDTEKGLAWARHALTLDPDEPMLLYNIGCI